MGDRIWYYYDCPKCGTKNGVEVYNAPSCLQYSERCRFCDFYVDLNYYYEDDEETILVLLSKEQARKRGYSCKECDRPLVGEERKKGICEDCRKKLNEKEV